MGLEERKTVEAPKVRLVRCPKCENLLPELPDFPVYQCGGCGAVLKAKKKGLLEDGGVSEITGTVKGTGISEDCSIVDVSKVGFERTQGNESSKVLCSNNEKVASGGCSTSRAGDRERVSDSDSNGRGKERIRGMDSDEDYRSHATSSSRNVNHGQNYDLNSNELQYSRFNGDHAAKELRPPGELTRKWTEMNQPDVAASIRPIVDVSSQLRLNKTDYNGRAPLTHDLNSCYEQVDRTRYNDTDFDGLARVKNLENDRAKLLRKIDELQDQISRSTSDVVSKQKEITDTNRRIDFSNVNDSYGRLQGNYIPEGFDSSHFANNQKLFPYDKDSSYLSHTSKFNPYTNVHGSSALSSYTHRGFQQEFHGNGDSFRPEMVCRPSVVPQSQYIRQSYHDQFPYHYRDANHDHLMLHRHENLFHQPGCSCVHCYDKNWRMVPNFDRHAFHNQTSRIEPSNPMLHNPMNPTPHGLQAHSFGGSGFYQMPSRQPVSLKYSDHDRPRKMTVAHRNGIVSHPVAGGAPFITCCNCFELLHLPRKCISSAKTHHKMKCGACSSIISFEVGGKGFIGSISVHIDQVPTEIDDGSSGTMDENVIYWPGDSNSADMNGYSNDFNDIQGKKSISDEDPHSSPMSFLENGRVTENVTSRKQDSTSSESHLAESTPPIMPPKTYPDQISDNSVIGQHDKGNKSNRTEKERVVIDRSNSLQTSLTDVATATEIDVPFNELAHLCVQDSVETDRDHSKAHKGSESFFAGFIKKSFRDFKKLSQSVEDGESHVSVNGHIIPARAIKKAEKFAGTIQPGEYWYDIHAGFWGVIGHPCLGIIMPQIWEFNYPLPENCSAGDTGIFVNGRELHQKDLDLLSGRGLPVARNRSYIVDISGNVIDEGTGEELDGLGKLAPTVERAKHGFGMKVPRYLT